MSSHTPTKKTRWSPLIGWERDFDQQNVRGERVEIERCPMKLELRTNMIEREFLSYLILPWCHHTQKFGFFFLAFLKVID